MVDPDDTITAKYPGLPEMVTLGDHVTGENMWFNPRYRGFSYVEAYDPAYWIETRQINQQDCFHPMYRMRSRSTLSPIDWATVAIWSNKYSSVIPEGAAPPAKGAMSVHFGLPLWFFRPSAVVSIADVIFEEWGLSGE